MLTMVKVTIEYVLLDHVNDGTEHAHQLAQVLKNTPCKINLSHGTRSQKRLMVKAQIAVSIVSKNINGIRFYSDCAQKPEVMILMLLVVSWRGCN